ncbi:hypothetical protein [Ralstonia phage RP13]|nr:hypothetical protein [Ralstonia phage RP13]
MAWYNKMDKIPRKYFYWEGNIIRTIYSNQRGFWLVRGRNLVRCDADGNILDPKDFLYATSTEATMSIPQVINGWLWRDMNKGLYPDFDAYNEQERQEYLNGWTDEKLAVRMKAKDEEDTRRRAEYDALPQIEKELNNFDWTHDYSDDRNASVSAAAHAIRILEDLDKNHTPEQAEIIFNKYGKGYGLKRFRHLASFYRGEVEERARMRARREAGYA